MNIDPKVEPWLRNLLDGVENSNNNAELVATQAYYAGRRHGVDRLVEQSTASYETMMRLSDQIEHKGHREIAEQMRQQATYLRAALAAVELD